MKTSLKTGEITGSGFEIIGIKELEELEADGVWARHIRTGVQVFHVYNDDPENLFSFAFATIPEDSTGAAHILEHSVLCGSKNYPLKDVFLVLAQGSLQTFLNAWTFPDKTIYPASSVNERDYFNLMAVYGDAVFRPLISEWTFMQEGHHLDFNKDSGKPEVTGVVYNEMKGAYSSLDAYAGLWSVKSVLPDGPYSYESGGDPECITDLSPEDLKKFHSSRYSPKNCRIFLAGNIPTEKQLAFLDEKFFSALPAGEAAPAVKKTQRWKEPREFRVPCPAGDQKPTVFISFLCCSSLNHEETIDLAALTETLLGHDGSPLTRVLIDSGLGEDLSPVTGFEGEILETILTVGLRGVDAKNQKKVEKLIMDELRRLADEGIPKEEIEASLLAMEFSHREIKRSGGPFSLVWMRRSLRAWLHGGNPWDSLLFAPMIDGLKKRLACNPLYFETLIKKYFLENQHRAFVIIEPKKGFLEEKENRLAARLAQKEAAMSGAEKTKLLEKNRELAGIQAQPDSPQALAAIPHLGRGDLSSDIEKIRREFADCDNIPIITHSLFTNGIGYADLSFPVDNLDSDDYPWLPLFSRVSVSMGLPGMDYGEVSSLLARTTGGFSAILQTGSCVPGSASALAFPSGVFDIRGRDWIIYRVKALDEKMGPSLDLARQLITEADFSDLKRIRDLVLEMKNEMDSGLAPIGHIFAALRSGRGFTRSHQVDEIWSGLQQMEFVHKISGMDSAEISSRLSSIRDKLVKSGILVNLACGSPSLQNNVRETVNFFGAMGPPRPRKNQTVFSSPYTLKNESVKPEIFSSPSLQIGFAASVLAAPLYGPVNQAAQMVASHLLSTGALWEEIRMKGGAYGAFAQPDILEGTYAFSTYRDPNPFRSLDTIKSVLNNYTITSDDELEKAVIGSYSRETRPRTAAEKSFTDFLRLLYGIEDHHRSERLAALINTGREQIMNVFKTLASSGHCSPVVICGEKDAEKAAKELGTTVKKLPA
ncbi:MAG: insulinase family protein [Treponema sp.]|nr:insulinase family protein [Treponema sp.]